LTMAYPRRLCPKCGRNVSSTHRTPEARVQVDGHWAVIHSLREHPDPGTGHPCSVTALWLGWQDPDDRDRPLPPWAALPSEPHVAAVVDGFAAQSELGCSHGTRITVRTRPVVEMVLNEGAPEEIEVSLTPGGARQLAALLVSAAAAAERGV
jgi:hypothetical protein